MKEIQYRGRKKLTPQEMNELVLKLRSIRGEVEKSSRLFSLKTIIILMIIGIFLFIIPFVCTALFSKKMTGSYNNITFEEVRNER